MAAEGASRAAGAAAVEWSWGHRGQRSVRCRHRQVDWSRRRRAEVVW